MSLIGLIKMMKNIIVDVFDQLNVLTRPEWVSHMVAHAHVQPSIPIVDHTSTFTAIARE